MSMVAVALGVVMLTTVFVIGMLKVGDKIAHRWPTLAAPFVALLAVAFVLGMAALADAFGPVPAVEAECICPSEVPVIYGQELEDWARALEEVQRQYELEEEMSSI